MVLRLYTAELDFHEDYLRRLADEASAGFAPARGRLAAHAGTAASGLEAARHTWAREHGAADWLAFTARLRDVAEGREAEPYIDFIHAVEAADQTAIAGHLDADPGLVNEVGSTRKPPLTSAGEAEAARLLLERGADVERAFPVPGGTALVHALIWGRADKAEALAEHSLAPDNLRVAAGLGRSDRLEALCPATGALPPEAGRDRAYYRPNDGWYPWQPADEPQEILDEALIYAATNGRIEAAALLVARGARIDGVAYHTRPLIRAAWRDQRAMVGWLLEQGADVDATGWLGGHCKGTTALHMAAQAGNRPLAELLLEAGADPTRRDDLYDGMPDGWAEHHGHPEVSAWLRQRREAFAAG